MNRKSLTIRRLRLRVAELEKFIEGVAGLEEKPPPICEVCLGREKAESAARVDLERAQGFGVFDVPLGKGLMSKILIEKYRQQCPFDSDDVIVSADIYLPCKGPALDRIHPEIVFRDRCHIFGDSLDGVWGSQGEPPFEGFRFQKERFTAPTWKEAASIAKNACLLELEELIQLISARDRALKKADEL